MASLVLLESIIIAAFSSLNKATIAQIKILPAELFTSIDVPCGCIILREATSRVRWYLSSNPDVYEDSGSAVAWWADEQTGNTEGYEINDDFSMKIQYLTPLNNKQLFRCVVVPADGTEDCTHDVKMDTYAKPENPPAIDYIRYPDHESGFNVTCSMPRVFPMTFPSLGSEGGNGTSDFVSNSDGTFDTKVAKYFSTAEVNTTIECVYSMRNFDSKSSLRVVDYGDISGRDGEGDSMDKNVTDTNFRYRCPELGIIWMILMMEIMLLILILYTILSGRILLSANPCNRDVRHPNERRGHDKATNLDGEDITVANLDGDVSVKHKNMSVSTKLFTAGIPLIIHLTVVILLLAFIGIGHKNTSV